MIRRFCLLGLICLTVFMGKPVSAGRLEDLRAEKQKKLQEAAEKQKKAKEEERVKKEYERQVVLIDNQKKQTEAAIVKTDQQISQTTRSISAATAEIRRLEGEVQAAEGRLNELAEEAYMSLSTSRGRFVGVVLGSENLTDAIRHFQAFESIQIEFEAERDRYLAAKAQSETRRAELLVLHRQLEVQKQQKEIQKIGLQKQIETKDRLAKNAALEVSRLNTEAQAALKAASQIEADIASEIRKLVAARKNNPSVQLPAGGVRQGEKVKAGQVIGYVGSTGFSTGPHVHYSVFVNGEHRSPRDFTPGRLSWPLEDFTVSQEYGPTSQTGFINRVYSFHNGIDLVSAYGSAVLAASEGTIILDQRYGGYGNAIVIDHGEGLFSLYGHMI